MVKSDPKAMPKRRKILVDPELLKEIEALERRIREDHVKNAEVRARVAETRRRLRRIYAGR